MASSLTPEEWMIERERLSSQIKSLEQQVEQLTSESSFTKSPVDAILREFYTLGLKLFQVEEPSEDDPNKPTPSEDGLIHIDPQTDEKGEESRKTIDALVQTIFQLYAPPPSVLSPDGKPKYLTGNFAPVKHETPPTSHNIIVEEGHIPECLNGMMLRNGPNPKFEPEGNYKWMDGDGMIHGLRFQNGIPTYVARYIQTSRHIQQARFQRAQLIKFGDLVGPYGLFASFVGEFRKKLNLLDATYGISTANTGLVYHGGRIMALEDFGQPHVIYVTEDSDLKTLGINNYNGKLEHWLSPHPKIDPATGEMFTLGSLRTSPYCIYRRMTKDGDIDDPVNITVSGPTYMHELCITENYVIFQDLPNSYDLEKMVTQEKEYIYNYDDTRRPRYGILPRYATSENDENYKIKWFEYPGSFFVYHNANAWEEEDGTIVLYCCNMEAKEHPKSGRLYIAPAMWQDFHEIEDFEITWPVLYKMTFDMNSDTNEPKKVRISHIQGDWPKINNNYVGRKTQYVYSGEVNESNKIISVVKYDLNDEKDGAPKRFKFCTRKTPHTYGSEVVFVPKTDSSTTDEDDGYLITFVHRENKEDSSTGISYVYVIDAKTMTSTARIRLPSRVPYGFHSIFVTEKELQDQIKPWGC